MTALHEHARQMLAYTIWADQRLLAAAEGIDAGQFGEIGPPLTHMLGTQRWWHANWTGASYVEPSLKSMEDARAAYAASHAALRTVADALTAEEWDRSEAWWKPWGYEQTMPLGESITQVFYHGAQHRSEIALVLTDWGRSPGDLDYLTFIEISMGWRDRG